MAYYDKKKKCWRGDISVRGKRHRRHGFLTKEIAETWEARVRIGSQRGEVGMETREEAEVESIIEKYLEHAKAHKKKASCARDELCLRWWRRFFAEKDIRSVAEIEPDIWQSFLAWRQRKPVTTRTLNLDMETLGKVFSFALESGAIKANPLTKYPRFRQPRPDTPKYLTIEELATLEDAAKKRRASYIYDAIAVLARTGMRCGELCSLCVSNVDLVNHRILLRSDQTKGNRARTIPTTGLVEKILSTRIEKAKMIGQSLLFRTQTGKPLDPIHFNRRFRFLIASTDIRDSESVNVHTLRKTYISHLIMAGEDPVKVMAIVGHQDWSTIKRYLALAPGYLKTDKLPY